MASMPAMDEGESKPKGKGLDLAIVMGKPKGGMDKPAPKGDEGGGDSLPPGFESAFSEVFPDMAGDQEKMMAMKRLIGTCMSDGDDY